jgi:antimicrobial peptide resistance and lipid A acylation protein PagP
MEAGGDFSKPARSHFSHRCPVYPQSFSGSGADAFSRDRPMKNADEGVHASRRIPLGYGRNSQRAFLALVLTFMAALTAGAAVADEMSLLVNGKAIHINTPAGKNLNEKNWGLGLQYDWDLADSKWRPFATASGFNDSNHNPSYYAGGGALRRFQFDGMHVGLGAVGFLMTRKDFKNERPFPGVLPVLSVGTKSVSLNVTYVPKVEPKAVPLLFFQIKMNLGIFQ